MESLYKPIRISNIIARPHTRFLFITHNSADRLRMNDLLD